MKRFPWWIQVSPTAWDCVSVYIEKLKWYSAPLAFIYYNYVSPWTNVIWNIHQLKDTPKTTQIAAHFSSDIYKMFSCLGTLHSKRFFVSQQNIWSLYSVRPTYTFYNKKFGKQWETSRTLEEAISEAWLVFNKIVYVGRSMCPFASELLKYQIGSYIYGEFRCNKSKMRN